MGIIKSQHWLFTSIITYIISQLWLVIKSQTNNYQSLLIKERKSWITVVACFDLKIQ